MSEDGYEWRELIQYHPDGIIEQLNKFGLKCAAIHDEEALFYFYYGLEDGVLTAALIEYGNGQCTVSENENQISNKTRRNDKPQ